MIKYRTNYKDFRGPTIERVEVERESESSVWIKGRRSNKRSDYANYFDTWEEAFNYLQETNIKRTEHLQKRIEQEEKFYEKMLKLRKNKIKEKK